MGEGPLFGGGGGGRRKSVCEGGRDPVNKPEGAAKKSRTTVSGIEGGGRGRGCGQ